VRKIAILILLLLMLVMNICAAEPTAIYVHRYDKLIVIGSTYIDNAYTKEKY
jgi:hypothetical protein